MHQFKTRTQCCWKRSQVILIMSLKKWMSLWKKYSLSAGKQEKPGHFNLYLIGQQSSLLLFSPVIFPLFFPSLLVPYHYIRFTQCLKYKPLTQTFCAEAVCIQFCYDLISLLLFSVFSFSAIWSSGTFDIWLCYVSIRKLCTRRQVLFWTMLFGHFWMRTSKKIIPFVLR